MNTKTNKIYNGISGGVVRQHGVTSKERINHDTLISTNVADQFNVYRSWASFNMTVDVDPLTQDDFKKDTDGNYIRKTSKEYTTRIQSTGVRSIFNKLHAVPLESSAYGWRVTQNMPLLDSPSNRKLQRSLNSCTVRDLVQKSQLGLMGTCVYDWADFMYCKYLGRVSNNYLITLRRYAIPVADYVKPYGNSTAMGGAKGQTTRSDSGGIPLGCMVTWMGTPGNDMSEILKYSFSMPFKETKSKFESDGYSPGGPRPMNSQGAIGKHFQKAFSNNAFQRLGNIVMPNMYNPRGGQSNPPGPAPYYGDPNKAYSGVDMIKSIYIRDGDEGLKFSNSFKLTFDYELRSYDGVNGKQALLDLLGNILTVCYTTGDFWPGAYRSEAHAGSLEPMSSLECMTNQSTLSGYVGAFTRDFNRIKGNLANMFKDPISAIKNLLDNLGGVLLGGNLEAASPGTQSGVNGLLSDSAVGLWHITVGNPCAPILSMGNMILKNTTIEHYGPLGLDDFPTGLRVTCEFEHGKPRDKRLIERMYIGGNDRIYMPLDERVADILKKAAEVNQKSAEGSNEIRPTKTNIANNGDVGAGLASTATTQERNEAQEDATQRRLENTKDKSSIEDRRVDVISGLTDQEILKRIFGVMAGNNFDQALRWSAGEVNQGVSGASTSSQSAATEGTKN